MPPFHPLEVAGNGGVSHCFIKGGFGDRWGFSPLPSLSGDGFGVGWGFCSRYSLHGAEEI